MALFILDLYILNNFDTHLRAIISVEFSRKINIYEYKVFGILFICL